MGRRVLGAHLIAVALITSAHTAEAGVNVWTSHGPAGGFVRVLAIDSTTATTLYAGTGAGVFKSTNGGDTWGTINTGLSNTDVLTLAIDPSTPATLYAGTGSGVFKSTDGGATWSPMNSGLTNLDVRALAIDPTTPSTLYAGTGGGVFAIQQAATPTPTPTPTVVPSATSTGTPGAAAGGCTLAGGERAGSRLSLALNLVAVVLVGLFRRQRRSPQSRTGTR